ncbi:hypothetical protein SELMODRAFT_270080 [Selaginella moellendorffii]|uniref:ER lumen protein retaining receptor n=1 Tax=Selaginella moellendorffii TaxID=88036 RepID=D8TDQ8_SELML|nr:putative ER lumen protein-retaining receptor C28H8.4 [Selaginella moellendorffii]EFJ05211.1 hypothetical protein SELMODRAFT_270080 [Selaginella moellendorffii]|eukprot:XP_002993719.1 putative ER lumen protein-retaining receptor C28H8.4 [Selaginella moellendorffii]
MGSARRPKNPIQALVWRIQRQNPRVKAALLALAAVIGIVFLRYVVKDHDTLFVASECVHALGIVILIYKLQKEKNCAGVSLRSQELTAIFLLVRLYCSTFMEQNIHTFLDTATLLVTAWVIYMIRTNLKATYVQELDNMPLYYVLAPCAVLAILVHPLIRYHLINRVLWAFCVYLEAVSVLPQLRVMQKAKLIEPFTALYVFALGVARFINCAHWLLQLIDGRGYLFYTLGTQLKHRSLIPYGLWPAMVVVAEIVQTFILADFCYYYVKSVAEGQMMIRLPSSV